MRTRIRTLAIAAACLVALGCEGDDHEHDCEVDAYRCSTDNVLEVCDHDEGWVVEEDCNETAGTECHAEMGHCMEMDSGMEM